MTTGWQNKLYFGDNLDILRKFVGAEAVDLIYLDPPFNSSRSYNVLFKETSGSGSAAQIQTFSDSWHWGPAAAQALDEVVHGPNQQAADLLQAMVEGLHHNDVTAYLCMMAVRLLELHRVLKPTGSLFLHCDPTAGPYLRVLLDAVFGPRNFRSEIVWRRSNAHNKLSRQFGPIHDTILFYGKTEQAVFHPGVRPHYRRYIADQFGSSDMKGPFRMNEITGAGTRTGDSGKPWKGIDITAKGRHWAIPRALTDALGLDPGLPQHQRLDALAAAGDIEISATGFPRYRQRATAGVLYQDIWAYQPYTEGHLVGTDDGIDRDVKWLEDEEEKLGYETQKPLGLLLRIISAASDEGAIVLDPFCGCGTAVHAAQRLERRWIGIDVTYLAVNLIERRIRKAFPKADFEVIGAPYDAASALDLAKRDKHQFEVWAVTKIHPDAQPSGKAAADGGIDGTIPLVLGGTASKPQYGRAVISVRGGKNVGVVAVRELIAKVKPDTSPIGILIIARKPTKEMMKEAAAEGLYHSMTYGQDYPVIQILTTDEIFSNKRPVLPPTTSNLLTPRPEPAKGVQATFVGSASGGETDPRGGPKK